MYQITIRIIPWDPKRPFKKLKSFTHKGLFIAKDGNCPERRIKKQVSRKLLPNYQKLNPTLKFRTSIKILKLPSEFYIKEE